jgi:hypothetical protein
VADSVSERVTNRDRRPIADSGSPAGEPRTAAPVDVERLAEAVYKLMLAEARLERARGLPIRRGR